MLIGVTACTARRNSRQESLFITCPICSLTAYTQWVKHFSTLAEPTKKHAFILCKHFADTYLLATPLGVLKSWHAVCLSCHFQQWHLECMLRLLRWLLQLNFFCSALFCFVLFLQRNLIILYLNLGVLGRLSVCFHGGVAGIFCCCYCLVGWYGLVFFLLPTM